MYASRLLHEMPCGIPRVWIPDKHPDGINKEYRGWSLKSRYSSWAEIEMCLYLQHVRFKNRRTFWQYNGGQIRPLKSQKFRVDFCSFIPEKVIIEMAECG